PTKRRFTTTLQRAQVTRIEHPETTRDYAATLALPVMDNIAAIRALPPEEAQRAYPVRLNAILTSVHALRDCYFLQMGAEGVYVDASDQNLNSLRAGQRVLVTGLTAAGGFAPVVTHPRLEVIGPAPMPKAREL